MFICNKWQCVWHGPVTGRRERRWSTVTLKRGQIGMGSHSHHLFSPVQLSLFASRFSSQSAHKFVRLIGISKVLSIKIRLDVKFRALDFLYCTRNFDQLFQMVNSRSPGGKKPTSMMMFECYVTQYRCGLLHRVHVCGAKGERNGFVLHFLVIKTT